MTNKRFDIDGMTCQGCVKGVEQALSALSGVKKYQVSLENNQAEIEYDETKTNPQAIIEAIENAGFDAKQAD